MQPPESVESPRHRHVRQIRELARSPEQRRSQGRCVVEGARLVTDLSRLGGWLERVLFDRERAAAEPIASALSALAVHGVPAHPTAPRALQAAAQTRSPQGIVGIAHRREAPLEALLQSADAGPVLVLWGLQDPGNVGGLARTAAAAGAAGWVVIEGGADPWGPKALRGAMTATFRLPVVSQVPPERLWSALEAAGVEAVATAPRGGLDYTRHPLAAPLALLVGSEAHGLPDEALERAQTTISVRLDSEVESLNVTEAATLVLFEARRRRLGGS